MSSNWNEWFAPMTQVSVEPFRDLEQNVQHFGLQPDGSPGASYVASIEIWWDTNPGMSIFSIVMTLGDGSVTDSNWWIGNFNDWKEWPTARHQRLDLQGGERIKTMKISTRTDGQLLSGISLTTIFGRDWSCSAPGDGEQRWQNVDVGSGLLIGAQSIERLFPRGFAFAFLKPVRSLALANVSYTTTPTNATAPIHMIDYMSKSFPNNTSNETEWEVSESSTDEQSFEWTVGLAVGLSMTASVSAGFFDIVEVNESVTWSIDASISTTNRSTESKTVAWKTSGHVSPGKEVEVMLRYGKGSFKSGYTGTLHVEMESGASIDIPCKGSFAQTVVGVEQAAASEKTSAH